MSKATSGVLFSAPVTAYVVALVADTHQKEDTESPNPASPLSAASSQKLGSVSSALDATAGTDPVASSPMAVQPTERTEL